MRRSGKDPVNPWHEEIKRRWQHLTTLEAACEAHLQAPAAHEARAETARWLRVVRFALLSTYLDALEAGVRVEIGARTA